MLSAALSASRRAFLLLTVFASFAILSFGLAGCAGVVSSSNGQTSTPAPTGLTISNVQAGVMTPTSAQLTWATSVPATSAIDYGTTPSYGVSTPVNTSMVTTHQMGVASLAAGTTYHFRVRSAAGSSNATSNDQTFSTPGGNADTTPPSVAITSPAAGAKLSGNVNVTAAASDDVAVTSVQFRVDGTNAGASLTAAPFAYVLNSTTLSNGSHTISAVAADAAGNSTTSASVTVSVDNTTKDTTPPTVTMTSPASGAAVSGTIAVTATAADNVSVGSVQFQLDGANLGAADAASPYVYSWDSTKTANGSHTLRAIATDGAGNTTTSASVTVTLDNTTKDTTAPTVTVTAPASGAKVSGVVTVSANATDNVSVASVQFQLDGANVGAADSASPFTYSWDTTKATNAAHTLRAIATDGAGNSTTSTAITVTVSNTPTDTTAPTVSISAPAAAAAVSGTVSVTANAADNVGVASVQFQVDGANAGGLDGAMPYGYTWDTTKVANGTHKLSATAKDAAGNTATSAIVSVTVNNAATPQTFTISGTLSPTTGGNGATVTLSGTSGATTTANSSGAYTFTGLAKGTYSVTPSHTGFTFSPAAQSTTITTANITGLNFTATATVAPTFTLSGTLSPTTGGGGATVTLSGTSGATTTANNSGAYTFTGLAAGTYSVTPSHTGFTFSPASQSKTITTANVTGVNFTATATVAPTFTISGTLSPTTGGGGATVTLSGKSSATTTASNTGAYTFTGLVAGTYAVTPSHTGFTFSPTTQSATITTANVTGVNFTATAQAPSTFTISGTITPTAGGSGATVLLSGAAGATTTTNSSGSYTFTGLANGNYTVTPNDAGFTFSPANQSVTVSAANKTGVNFTAASNKPHSVALSWSPSSSAVNGYNVYRSTVSGTGFSVLNSSLIGGTSFDDTTVQSGTTYFYVTTSVDSGGDESAHSNQATAAIP
jgi:Bacterial Ig domain/Carboxypeptidase regulatory-like domain